MHRIIKCKSNVNSFFCGRILFANVWLTGHAENVLCEGRKLPENTCLFQLHSYRCRSRLFALQCHFTCTKTSHKLCDPEVARSVWCRSVHRHLVPEKEGPGTHVDPLHQSMDWISRICEHKRISPPTLPNTIILPPPKCLAPRLVAFVKFRYDCSSTIILFVVNEVQHSLIMGSVLPADTIDLGTKVEGHRLISSPHVTQAIDIALD